ncbi:TPA: hypothetical protein ACF3H3_000040 [Escherichia coli]
MTPTSVITFLLIAAIAIAFFGSNQFKKDIKNIFKYKVEELKTPEDETKTETEKSADRIQFFCQRLIFIGLTGFLLFKGTVELADTFWPIDISSQPFFAHIRQIKTLSYVAKALAVSCGFQLAFMLITKGPDEAVEPIMLGIASVILLMLSVIDPDKWTVHNSISVVLLIICIAGLFFLSKKLKNNE